MGNCACCGLHASTAPCAASAATCPGSEGGSSPRHRGKGCREGRAPHLFSGPVVFKKAVGIDDIGMCWVFFGVCVQQTVILSLGSPNTSNAMKCYQDMQNWNTFQNFLWFPVLLFWEGLWAWNRVGLGRRQYKLKFLPCPIHMWLKSLSYAKLVILSPVLKHRATQTGCLHPNVFWAHSAVLWVLETMQICFETSVTAKEENSHIFFCCVSLFPLFGPQQVYSANHKIKTPVIQANSWAWNK